jgi:hypothetical protein
MSLVQTNLSNGAVTGVGLTKKCRACKKIKAQVEFSKNKFSIDGINPYCLECVDRKKNRR